MKRKISLSHRRLPQTQNVSVTSCTFGWQMRNGEVYLQTVSTDRKETMFEIHKVLVAAAPPRSFLMGFFFLFCFLRVTYFSPPFAEGRKPTLMKGLTVCFLTIHLSLS